MVFILRHVTTGITAVLGENRDYTIGRSRLNSILLRDETCEKKHAKIIIKHGIATIKVLSPQAAVFIDGQQIHNENETVLKPGDAIIFGANNTCYSFIDPKFQVFIDDSVIGDEKEGLCKILNDLQVKVLKNYSNECTHFVTPALTLDKLKNTKILEHFLNKKTIVNPKFWIDIYNNIDLMDAAEIPNIYRYMPVFEEIFIDQGIEVVKCRKMTKNLFQHIPCIFFDETVEMDLKHTIMKCGGLTFLHDGKVNFVQTLLKVMNFNTALVITPKEHDEPPIIIGHFINKLREMNKKVYEVCEDDIYISVLKGKLNIIGNNEILEVEPNQNLNNIIALDDDLSVQSNIIGTSEGTSKDNRKKNYRTLDRWVTPTKKKKKIVGTKSDESIERPSTSCEPNYGEISQSSVPNKKRNNKKRQKTGQGNNIETEEKLDISLEMPDTDSDELSIPNKRIEEVQKKAKEDAAKQAEKDFRSLSMSTSDSDSKSSNNSSQLPILSMKNRINTDIDDKSSLNGEGCNKKHLNKTSDNKSGPNGSSKRLKINPLAKLKEINEKRQKDSSVNISYLKKMYKDVEFEPCDDA